MKLEINLNGNVLDYIDEEDLKDNIQYEVKSQIKQQLQSLIEENKNEIQNQLVTKIVKELLNTITFNISLKDIIYKKICDGIEYRYSEDNNYNLYYDLQLNDKVNEIFAENKDVLNPILSQKLDEALKNYKVNDYVFSERISHMLVDEQKYKEQIQQLLESRLDDILDKI